MDFEIYIPITKQTTGSNDVEYVILQRYFDFKEKAWYPY